MRLLCASNLTVGKTSKILFDCVYHGYCALPRDAGVVLEFTATLFEVYILLLSVNSEGF